MRGDGHWLAHRVDVSMVYLYNDGCFSEVGIFAGIQRVKRCC